MKTLSVRDLRRQWSRVEAMLEAKGEILITRDSKPVAKLVWLVGARAPFDPKAHRAWQARLGRGRVVRWVDEFLARDRDAR